MTYESKCVGISQIRVPDPDRNDCRPRIRILESAYLIGWILRITGDRRDNITILGFDFWDTYPTEIGRIRIPPDAGIRILDSDHLL
jgi:hypothetical protein